MKTYLVGGAVRDILLGQAPVELDYAVDETMPPFWRRIPMPPAWGKAFRSVCGTAVNSCRSVVGACLRIWPPVT